MEGARTPGARTATTGPTAAVASAASSTSSASPEGVPTLASCSSVAPSEALRRRTTGAQVMGRAAAGFPSPTDTSTTHKSAVSSHTPGSTLAEPPAGAAAMPTIPDRTPRCGATCASIRHDSRSLVMPGARSTCAGCGGSPPPASTRLDVPTLGCSNQHGSARMSQAGEGSNGPTTASAGGAHEARHHQRATSSRQSRTCGMHGASHANRHMGAGRGYHRSQARCRGRPAGQIAATAAGGAATGAPAPARACPELAHPPRPAHHSLLPVAQTAACSARAQ